MKKILITGADSYIGTSFEKWTKQYPDRYYVDTLDMRNKDWRKYSFDRYDVIFHVAGIAHVKITSKNKDLYYGVNTELAIKTARTAKLNKIPQFIFMSSMSSTYDTQPSIKKTIYGESKYLAEQR